MCYNAYYVGTGKRTYRAKMDAPGDGRYVAFMIDVKYKEMDAINFHFDHMGNNKIPVDKPGRLEFTTEVSVWPNTFPYADCYAEGCNGAML